MIIFFSLYKTYNIYRIFCELQQRDNVRGLSDLNPTEVHESLSTT